MECSMNRSEPMVVSATHVVNGNTIVPPFPDDMDIAMFGMGCFWGPERRFWQTEGVYSTHVGYTGGSTTHPTYEDVCSNQTSHVEVIRIVYDPKIISYHQLLQIFWENHDVTMENSGGRKTGDQYRSCIFYYNEEQRLLAESTMEAYQARLTAAGRGKALTQTAPVSVFYYAEDYHQQYLEKNPDGYCGAKGTGVKLE